MQAERWQHVEHIFQSALRLQSAEREAYLRAQCGRDQDLFHQVVSMLSIFESSVSDMKNAESPALWPGDQFAQYEIIRTLGSGGMGTVYLARDADVGRLVALKLIAVRTSRAEEHIRRFQIEARAASALNHANIITVYDAGEYGGRRFITSEYIDGITLRERMGSGRMPVATALGIARQIALAVASAHEAGILHRDLKPENIMIRHDGVVKVLDFGLARISADAAQTAEGALLGTVPYMSPEQTRGERADARSDVWSWGVMLYEMLAGKHPFTSSTAVETIGNIRTSECTNLPNDIDREVRRLVQSSLAVNPYARPSRGDALVAELDRLEERSRNRRWRIAAIAGGVLLLLVCAASFLLFRQRTAKVLTRAVGRVIPLTDTGDVVSVALSRDGSRMAYVTETSGGQTLWIRDVTGGNVVRLLDQRALVFRGIALSPANDFVYYTLFESDTVGSIYRIPAAGGTPHRVVYDADSPPAISPDGSRLAFIRYDFRTAFSYLITAAGDGSQERVLATRPGPDTFMSVGVSWSPNGSTIAAVAQAQGRTRQTVTAVQAKNGEPVPVTSRLWLSVERVAWSPRGLLLVASEDDAHPPQIVRLAQEDELQFVTQDLNSYADVSAADTGAIVAVRRQRTSEIWAGPSDHAENGRQVSAVGRFYGVDWVGNGELLTQAAFTDIPEFWVMRADGGGQRIISEDKVLKRSARICGNSQPFIVFSSNHTGSWKIWRMGLDGSNPRQLTVGPGADFTPTCSADGKWVVFSSGRSGSSTLWKVSSTAGEPAQISADTCESPELSPDGQLVVCTRVDAASRRTGAVTVLRTSDGGAVRRLRTVPEFAPARWTSDSKTLVYVRTENGVSNLWATSMDGGADKQITKFDHDQIFSFDWSGDGSQVALVRGREVKDAILIGVDDSSR